MLWNSADDLFSIKDSPSRLPVRFANELYRAGETGMGYLLFTIVFSWWPRRECVALGTVGFVDYPRWRGPSAVKAVPPHVGSRRKKKHRLRQLESHFCVFSK